ncbi:MAG: hypothetical protein M0C28_16100 [Candidatus Moduliflexus flocculans]|nr:hypothetical protein [Candidatus Moduliflexus flocculans]
MTIDLDRQLLHARLSAKGRSVAARRPAPPARRPLRRRRLLDPLPPPLRRRRPSPRCLRESARVARVAVVALDLTRHRIPLADQRGPLPAGLPEPDHAAGRARVGPAGLDHPGAARHRRPRPCRARS